MNLNGKIVFFLLKWAEYYCVVATFCTLKSFSMLKRLASLPSLWALQAVQAGTHRRTGVLPWLRWHIANTRLPIPALLVPHWGPSPAPVTSALAACCRLNSNNKKSDGLLQSAIADFFFPPLGFRLSCIFSVSCYDLLVVQWSNNLQSTMHTTTTRHNTF